MRQAPLPTIVLGSHAVVGPQIQLQHLHLLPVLEAHEVVVMDGPRDRNGRSFGRSKRLGQVGLESLGDHPDEGGEIRDPDSEARRRLQIAPRHLTNCVIERNIGHALTFLCNALPIESSRCFNIN